MNLFDSLHDVVHYLKQLTDKSLKAGQEAMQREVLSSVDNSKHNQDEATQYIELNRNQVTED